MDKKKSTKKTIADKFFELIDAIPTETGEEFDYKVIDGQEIPVSQLTRENLKPIHANSKDEPNYYKRYHFNNNFFISREGYFFRLDVKNSKITSYRWETKSGGYQMIKACFEKGKDRKRVGQHQLIAWVFGARTTQEARILIEKEKGKAYKSLEVHHINANPRDNRLENLEINTISGHYCYKTKDLTLVARATKDNKQGQIKFKQKKGQDAYSEDLTPEQEAKISSQFHQQIIESEGTMKIEMFLPDEPEERAKYLKQIQQVNHLSDEEIKKIDEQEATLITYTIPKPLGQPFNYPFNLLKEHKEA